MDLKSAALSALHHSGALALVRGARRHGLVVMTYHGVLAGHDDQDAFLLGNFVAEEAFARQMAWIARRYRPVSMTEVVEALTTGRPLPARAIAVTFDDGFANNFRFAFPILRRYRVPATIFLTTGFIGERGVFLWTERVKRAIFMAGATHLPELVPGQPSFALDSPGQRANAARAVLSLLKRMPPDSRNGYVESIERECGRPPLEPQDVDRYDFLTWDDVRTMAADGVEFGSHTVTHPILSTLPPQNLADELRRSKEAIEAELQRPCRVFAYPNGGLGDFGAREKLALKACNYQVAFSQMGGVNGGDVDPYEVRRVNISRGFRPALLEAALSGALQLGKAAGDKLTLSRRS